MAPKPKKNRGWMIAGKQIGEAIQARGRAAQVAAPAVVGMGRARPSKAGLMALSRELACKI